MSTDLNTKLDIIKGYTLNGWHLIPLHYPTPDGCSCWRKDECPTKTRGKHPQYTDWTDCTTHVTSFEQAKNVWGPEGNPKFNVGIVTGECSGIVVIDVDGEQGLESLDKLIADTGQDLRLTLTYRTGSGGLHLIFENPRDVYVTNSNKNLKKRYPGLDIRGNGGQIVVCPSQSGKGDYSHLNDNMIMQLSDAVLDLIQTPYEADVHLASISSLKNRSELPENVQQMCDVYAQRGIEKELKRFEDEYDLPGWDDLTNQVAFNCLTLAHSPWNDLDENDVADQIFRAAPRGGDGDWTELRIEKCIDSAFLAVTTKDKVRKMPPKAEELLKQTEAVRQVAHDWDGQVMGFDGLKDYFTQDYLIEEYLPINAVCRLFGASGSFKSFVVLDMSARISLGLDWYGQQVKKGNVLYIAAEGEQGMYKRALAWNQHHGVEMNVHFLPRRLQVKPGGAEWNSFIEWMASKDYDLIIFDTQAKTTIGVQENDNTEFGRIVDAWEDLREKTGACVLIIHHTGHTNTDRARGNSATNAAINTELRVEKKDARYATITSPKQKDEDDQNSIRLLMQKIVVDGLKKKSGAPETSLVPTRPFTIRGAQIMKHDILAGQTNVHKQDVVDLIAKLDEEEVPLTEGFDAVKTRLLEWDMKASTTKIKHAIKIRKEMGA